MEQRSASVVDSEDRGYGDRKAPIKVMAGWLPGYGNLRRLHCLRTTTTGTHNNEADDLAAGLRYEMLTQ